MQKFLCDKCGIETKPYWEIALTGPTNNAIMNQGSRLIGTMLINNKLINEYIDHEFLAPKHREIFKAMLSLYTMQLEVDMLTLSKELKDRNTYEEIGGAAYLASLVDRAFDEDEPDLDTDVHELCEVCFLSLKDKLKGALK